MRNRPAAFCLALLLVAAAMLAMAYTQREGGGRNSEARDQSSPGVIVAGTEGSALPRPPSPRTAFTLAILPDRTTGSDWGLPYLERAVDDLNLLDPDVVFTIGDMVQGYTRSIEQYDREADEYERIVSALHAPLYLLPGNHDVISGARDPNDRTFENRYLDRFGPLYYSVSFESATVVALYSDEKLQSEPFLSEAQTTWARDQIAAAARRGRPLLVLLHKPMWRYSEANWDAAIHKSLANAAKSIDVLVIAGHFHSMQRDEIRDGVEYHLVGTCGGAIDQGPLAGQLQHISFVRFVNDEPPAIHHLPVGVTLPDDFILRADQDRVFRLKSSDHHVEIVNALEQPVRQGIDDAIRVRVSNPIDRPIEVEAAVLAARPAPQLVEGYSFYSRTEQDLFNPHTWNIDTPLRQTAPAHASPLTLAPGEERMIEIPVVCAAQGHAIPPPQLRIVARFRDEQDREVPVIIRRRAPLRMRYEIGSDGKRSAPMPISSYVFSVYDRLEADPHMTLLRDGDRLIIDLEVPDNKPCYYEMRSDDARVEDPMSDAVRLTIGAGLARAVYLIEPFGPASQAWLATPLDEKAWRLDAAPDVRWDCESEAAGYRLTVELPLQRVGRPGDVVSFNVEVADNDETYHTQWRQWANPRFPNEVELPVTF